MLNKKHRRSGIRLLTYTTARGFYEAIFRYKTQIGHICTKTKGFWHPKRHCLLQIVNQVNMSGFFTWTTINAPLLLILKERVYYTALLRKIPDQQRLIVKQIKNTDMFICFTYSAQEN